MEGLLMTDNKCKGSLLFSGDGRIKEIVGPQ
jgi:hypothetical protein